MVSSMSSSATATRGRASISACRPWPTRSARRGGAVAAARSDRRPCSGGRTAARRRHPGAGYSQRQDRHRAGLGLCARRCAVRESGPAGGSVPLLAQPVRRSPGRTSSRLRRDPSGRCLCRLPAAPRAGPLTGTGDRGTLLDASSTSSPTSLRTSGAASARRRSRRWRWRR